MTTEQKIIRAKVERGQIGRAAELVAVRSCSLREISGDLPRRF